MDLLESIVNSENFPYLEISQDLISKLDDLYRIIEKLNKKEKTILKIELHQSIEKERVDVEKIIPVIRVIEELRSKYNINYRIIGSLDLILNLYRDLKGAKTSNVIDIVVKSKKEVEIIKNEFIKRGAYEISPKIYTICFSYNNRNLCMPNQIGYYSYLEFEIRKITVYPLISREGNIVLQKSKYDIFYFIDNIPLFTILYKFLRYQQKDIEDLKSLEKNVDPEKWEKLPKYFSPDDKEKVLEIFGDKGIRKIEKNYKDYIRNHPNSIYKEIDPKLILR